MDAISICDLQIHCRIGVTPEERATPQRLLLDVRMELDLARAAQTDDLVDTVDYYEVSRRIRHYVTTLEWNLIETLAADIIRLLFANYRMETVEVEVKKFVIPEARHVSVRLRRNRL